MQKTGIGELEQKIVLVAGGAGTIGEEIVKVLLAKGAFVVVPSSSEELLCRIRDRMGNHRRLYTPLANIATLCGAKELLDWLKVEMGSLDAVIASLAKWWEGIPLVDVSLDTWHKHLEKNLTAHFILAKIFLPFLFDRTGSSYLFVGSLAGKMAVSSSGPVAITGAGEIMLKDILDLENRDKKVRINSLLIKTSILEKRAGEILPDLPSGEEMGHYCAFLISDRASEIRGETIIFENRKQLAGILD